MAARLDGKQGYKADKLFRDALMVAVKRATAKGSPTKRLAALADALVEKGVGGDVPAIKEIADRLDGKPMQGVALDVAVAITTIERRIIDPVELAEVVTLKIIEKHDDDA